MKRNIISLLRESQIRGVGLKVVGERVWENNEENEVSVIIIASIPGGSGKAVIPVLGHREIEDLKGKMFYRMRIACAFNYVWKPMPHKCYNRWK